MLTQALASDSLRMNRMPLLAVLAVALSVLPAFARMEVAMDALALLQVRGVAEPSDAGSTEPQGAVAAPTETMGSSDEDARPIIRGEDRLLLFWAVSSASGSIEQVVANIDHARTFEAGHSSLTRPLRIDVYLAHYDFNRSGWQATLGDWYSRNVQYSAELSGVKMWILKDLLLRNYTAGCFNYGGPVDELDVKDTRALAEQACVEHQKHIGGGGIDELTEEQVLRLPKVDPRDYEFIWALDEDASFGGDLDLRLMVDVARRSGAKIITPSFLFQGEHGDSRLHDKRSRLAEERSRFEAVREAFWKSTGQNATEKMEELRRRLAQREACRERTLETAEYDEHEMRSLLEEEKTLFEAEREAFNGGNVTGTRVDDQIKAVIYFCEVTMRRLTVEREKFWKATGQNVTAKREELKQWWAELEARRAAVAHDINAERKVMWRSMVEAKREFEAEKEAFQKAKGQELTMSMSDYQGEQGGWQSVEEEADAVLSSGCQDGDSLCWLQAPRGACWFRYTNFVELSFPLIKPSALLKVLGDCPFCLKNRGTAWGLDKVWCSVAADRPAEAQSSCAVLDHSVVRNLDGRTLPKWRSSAANESRACDHRTYLEVRASGRSFWTEDARTHACMPPPDPAHCEGALE